MGSPVSPIVANLYMENFEVEALASAPHRPNIWYRYVDDTFTMMRTDEIQSLTDHLNSRDPNIKFTFEIQEEDQLAFLDVLVKVKDDGSTKVCIYRKPTHTDQYLNFCSNHHLQHKRSVVRTLMYRAENVISEAEDVKLEKEHIRRVLTCNDYKKWSFELPKKHKAPPPEGAAANRATPIGLIYIKGLSENLQRIYRKHGVNVYHKPDNTLRSLLVKVKDKDTPTQKSNAIYHLQCGDCEKDYIGETGRGVGVRFKEHINLKHSTSAITEHMKKAKHKFTTDQIKILGCEDHVMKRRVKETLAIRKSKPSLNRDLGYELAPVYQQLLSRVNPPSRGNSSQQSQL